MGVDSQSNSIIKTKPDKPEIITGIVNNLKVLAPNLTHETLLGITLSSMSYALCVFRVKFKENSSKEPKYPNLFTSFYLHSGMGKDTVAKLIKKLVFSRLTKFQEENNKAYKQYLREKIKKEFVKNNKDWDPDKIEKETENKLAKERRFTLGCNSSGTEEGLYAEMYEYSKRNTGSVFVQQSESGVFQSSSNNRKADYLDRLFSGYDNRIEGRNLRDVSFPTVEEVPMVVEFLSNPDILIGNSNFLRNQNSGFGRRFWIFMQTSWKKTTVFPTEEEEITAVETLKNYGDQLFDIYFKKIMEANTAPLRVIEKIEKDPETGKEKTVNELYEKDPIGAIFNFDTGVYTNCYMPYKSWINKRCNNIENKQIRDSLSEHPFRACKVACIYAVLNHPDELLIKEEDFEQAKQTVESTDGIMTFVDYTPDAKDKFDYIVDDLIKDFESENHPEDGIYGSGKLTELIDNAIKPVVTRHRRQTVRELISGDNFDNTKNILKEDLLLKGYDLQSVALQGNFKGFKIVKLSEPQTVRDTDKEVEELFTNG